MMTRPRIVPKTITTLRVLALVAGASLGLAGRAQAQLPIPVASQFDITGFIQVAALDPTCVASAHCGGSLTVNGHVIVVPKELIVILPANALSWQELFAQAPAPYGLAAAVPSTGMALTDVPAPISTYEVHVVGNRVVNAAGDRYIAGMVHISQQDLNSGAGFINFIDYTTGEFRVGGAIGNPATGARVRINDPVGRFGRVNTPDGRFCVDDANPTIAAGTGFPMCLPRTDPLVADDPLCPQGNRPAGATLITMNDPNLLPGILPDPKLQVPMEVGDYVTFAGTLVSDNLAAPTVALAPGSTTGTYISAHTITSNVAVFTAPGTNPAYVSVEVALIGTGGLTVIGAGEAVIRTRFEGMTTDPSRNIHLYGIDLNPLTGATSDRDWGTIGVDPGPPIGAVKGRWRFRPPCTATPGTITDKSCSPPALGVFIPPTQEMRAVIEGLQAQNPAIAGATTTANGIFYGQYHAPIGEFIFPENIPGTPIVPNNFETIGFLAQGGYTSAAGTLAGQLNPWPGAVAPAAACTLPVAAAGNPQSVAFGATNVSLTGSATGTPPFTFSWTTSAGTLTNPGTATPTLSVAGLAAGTVVNLTLAVTGCGASSTATTTVTVNGATAPTVSVAVAPAAAATTGVASGTNVRLTASGTVVPAAPITFTWRQTGGPVAVIATPTNAASVNFTRVLPLGQVTSDVFTFTVTGTANGVTSGAQTVTITIKPVADVVTVTSTQYRTSKQRLTITATSSVISPNVTLTLRPYTTNSGAVFDPTNLGNSFTNNGGGLYTLTLVGAPQPAAPPALLTVTSNLGGSGSLILQQVRQ